MTFRRLSFLSLTCITGALLGADIPTLSLEDLTREILAQNPERAFYTEQLAAARTQAKSATRWNDPEVTVELGRKRLRSGPEISDGTVWSVSVAQAIEWPGRLALRKALANHDTELAELGLARFEAALEARALQTAFGLHAAVIKADACLEVATRFASLKETFLARDPAGLTPLLETRVIEASELALQKRASDAEIALQTALLQLNQLRNAPVDTPLRVEVRRARFSPLPDPKVLLASARQNSFEYRAKVLELEQQGYAVSLARNERMPALTISPYLSRDPVGDRETIIGLGLSVPLPLSGRSSLAVESARAKKRQAEAALFVAERELERDVAVAAQSFETKTREIARWSNDTVERFRQAADLADRHFRAGAVALSTYVELQTTYLEAVEALLDTEADALDAALRLRELTGHDLFQPKDQP